jgi:RNA polymerase sigma factor (sigma-70 family)
MEAAAAHIRPVGSPGRWLRNQGDERLVARLRGGDDRAFEAIYDRYHRGLLSFCRHMLANREEAEDALQHTFAAAYRSLLGSDRDIHLKAWLYTIARNHCLSVLRARREQVSLDDVEPATEGLAAEVERRRELRELLSDLQRLPEDQRAALVLSELGAHSHEEVAVILGVRREKVKALVFQARAALLSSRGARETSCQEIQEQLSVLRGGALRRASIRRHLDTCPACQAFRADVARQRAAMAVLLPVVPSVALKGMVLGPVIGAGAAAAAGGLAGWGAGGGLAGSAAGGGALAGSAAGGGLTALGKGLATKVLVAAAVAGSLGGGAVAVEEWRDHSGSGASGSGGEVRATPATPAIPQPGQAATPANRAQPSSRSHAAHRNRARRRAGGHSRRDDHPRGPQSTTGGSRRAAPARTPNEHHPAKTRSDSTAHPKKPAAPAPAPDSSTLSPTPPPPALDQTSPTSGTSDRGLGAAGGPGQGGSTHPAPASRAPTR